MIGKTISHYRIIEKLGEGGMGEVYLAQDLNLDRNVAIKFLPAHMTQNIENVERFRREAKAAAAINHPNIVTIHEIIDAEDRICIVMEHVKGQTLREMINTPLTTPLKRGKEASPLTPSSLFPIPNYTNIISQICSGLSTAHKAGIIHRDIKPENMLIDQQGQVKILDFGLAKLKGVSNLTQENSTLGTIHYMSPEQTKGEFVDHRSDIWSVGVVLYEMASGEKPFKGDYEQAIMYSILNEELSDLDKLPKGIGSIIDKCLKKSPDDRYQNIEDLAHDVKLGETSKESLTKERAEPSHKRSSLWIVIPVLLAIVITGFLILKYWPSGSEEKPQWINSIAVLPFDDLSVEKNQDHFCMGMTEQILSNLTKLTDLKVIARTSVMQYKNTQKPISEIASELDVKNILEGSIQRSGEKIRIHVQLINASTGSYLWSDNYDSSIEDLFALQDEVSKKVADVMNFKLHLVDNETAVDKKLTNTEAYEYCLKGEYISRYFLLSQPMSEHFDLFDLGENHFKRALQMEPDFTRARLSLAEHYLAYTFLHGDQELLNIAKKYIDEVVESDPTNAFAIALQGGYYNEIREFDDSYSYLINALKINPNSGKAHFYLAQFFLEKGLQYQAKDHFEKAVKIDPLNTRYLIDCGTINQDLSLFDQAEKFYFKLLEINPDHALGRFVLFWNNLYANKVDKAEKYLTEHLQMFPDFDLNDIAESSLYAVKGEKEKCMALKVSSVTNLLLLNMRDEGIELLQREFKHANVGKSRYLELINFTVYDRIRDDHRFQKLVSQQKNIYENNLKKYVNSDVN